MNAQTAPHITGPRPRVARWACGAVGHRDRNASNDHGHYAFCVRCGALFGNVWSNDVSAELRAIDLVLGNRPAFDGAKTRVEKIQRAINAARAANP